ncbi:hypothetical protein GCM10011391_29930 [Pullulanibacillus camelliae]|uniref:Uncharacterized protein n=1 Tax=Pullulanibacillus camelliae TaxID=1707096 RepID=A0A8J3DY34_9BACL|nr:hypothetical protein [Pullulanibacillus camelliae]GGE49121.1 hypothetical protein GCM10011391_29930 [Pullulanibacillus camelliae]
MKRKRYVRVGTGGRAAFYYSALVTAFKETADLVAFCDINKQRLNYANKLLENKYQMNG